MRFENENNVFRMAKGIAQGLPLSPLLSNIYLTEFDKYMEGKYQGYCRFADDIRVLVKTRAEAKQVMTDIETQLSKLDLKLKKDKCGIYLAVNRPCFGFELLQKEERIIVQKIKHQKGSYYHDWGKMELEEKDHHYHIVTNGILTKKEYTLLFENDEGKHFIPVESTAALSIYSDVVFSSSFFDMANQEGLPVNFIDRFGNEIGRYVPTNSCRSFKTEMKQIDIFNKPEEKLALAKTFQYANIFNVRATLRYYERRAEGTEIKSAISAISGLLKQVSSAKTVNELMALEAQARQKYYHCFNSIIGDSGYMFEKRTRRPPADPINALISFGNTLMYTRVANAIYRSELDIRFGILHSSATRPENLHLDLADLFKPVIVDRVIFTVINKRMLDAKGDFEEKNGGVYLTERGKRIYIEQFNFKLMQKMTYQERSMTYSQLIEAEVKSLQNYFKKDEEYKPYKYVN